MSKLSRRELLAGLTGGAFLVSGESFAWSEGVDTEAHPADNSEYLFEPGLNYLNTAALGPTPRTILDNRLPLVKGSNIVGTAGKPGGLP
ncbi:MAG TPA: hypothetical protein VLG74_08070 [Blastocatellia bacterium]|nr:hypothetical protein [Blastocatellia bacterium]